MPRAALRLLCTAAVLLGGPTAGAQAGEWGEFRSGGDNRGVSSTTLDARWDVQVGQPVRALSVSGHVLVAAADRSGTVMAIDLPTGRMLWRQRMPTSVHNDPVISDSTVVVTFGDLPQDSSAGGAWAFDVRDGHELWRHPIRSALMASPALVGHIVVLTGSDDCVYGLALRSGQQLYRTCIAMSPAMSNPKRLGTSVFYGTTDGRVVAINGTSGAVQWVHRLPMVQHAGDATVAVGDGALFITGTSWSGFRPFLRDTSLWSGLRTVIDAFVHDRFADRSVLFARQRAVRLSASDGEIQWSTELSSGRRVTRNLSGTPALAGSHVVVSSPVGSNLTALNAATGAKEWVVALPSRHRGVPTIFGDTVLVGLESGALLAFDLRTGRLLGHCSWTGRFTPSAPLIVGQTIIYGATDGILRAVPMRDVRAALRRGGACVPGIASP
ncbi:MAG: PQQ-binding-like beta-propeller repeat protein [bacterium]